MVDSISRRNIGAERESEWKEYTGWIYGTTGSRD